MLSITATLIKSTRVVQCVRLLHTSPIANMPIQVRLWLTLRANLHGKDVRVLVCFADN